MWPGTGRSALEIPFETLSEFSCGQTPFLVDQSHILESERARMRAKTRRENRDQLSSRTVELIAQPNHLLGPGLNRLERGVPGARTAQSSIPLRQCAGVVGRKIRTRGIKPTEHPVEIRPPDQRAAFDHGEAVRRERECRETQAKFFSACKRCAVQANELRRLRRNVDLGLEGGPTLRAGQLYPCGRLAETDEPRLCTRPGGEPLRSHVQRLEEVRLTDPVWPGHEHDPGNESELELWVGAKVSKRDVRDDQPASLIGMIR